MVSPFSSCFMVLDITIRRGKPLDYPKRLHEFEKIFVLFWTLATPKIRDKSFICKKSAGCKFFPGMCFITGVPLIDQKV